MTASNKSTVGSDSALKPRDGADLRTAVLCSFNLDMIKGPLEGALASRGLPAKVYLSGYGQWETDARAKASALHRLSPHVAVLVLDIRDLIPEFNSHLPTRDQAAQLGQDAFARVETTLRALLARLPGAAVLCAGLAPPPINTVGLLEGNSNHSWRAAADRFNEQLQTMAAAEPRLFYLEIRSLIEQLGWRHWEDSRLWFVGRMRLGRDALEALAGYLARAIGALMEPRRKCLVLDLDNTLWGGVVGEDGLKGIRLGHSGPGLAYLEFQQAARSLLAKGIVLAVCSKNNAEDALEVFRKHPYMALKEDDLSVMEISWEDKSLGLKRIAEKLNIGLGSLVFWDDSPIERSRIRSTLPDVLVPDVPEDPSLFRDLLLDLEAFDTLELTREDVRRAAMYREEAHRRTLAKTLPPDSPEAFYRSCRIEMHIKPGDAFSLPRLAQLVLKTNQFNMSTIRYTTAQLEAFTKDPAIDLFSLEVSDRFGDLGIVGMAIVRTDRSPWLLDTFLLSCRALGRTIEHGFLGCLLARATRSGARLAAMYRPTPKNEPVRRFFGEMGLVLEPDEEGTYHCSIPKNCVKIPQWLTLTVEE